MSLSWDNGTAYLNDYNLDGIICKASTYLADMWRWHPQIIQRNVIINNRVVTEKVAGKMR